MDNFEQHLMQKYPELFYEKQNGELECPCGVWVPTGWESIVDNLCGSINYYVTKHPPTVKVDQIKEKFGGLRFYISGGDNIVQGMIQFAEYMCHNTCEVTGQPGELCIRNNWLKTLSTDVLLQPEYIGYKPVETKRKQD